MQEGGHVIRLPQKKKQSLITTLYQILQCLHQQRNINTGKAGPKSFRKIYK